MNKVGDNYHFRVSITPVGYVRYVWHWWDGTTTVTESPETYKVLNMGGNPIDSNKLYYTVDVLTQDGTAQTVSGNVVVPNPPVILPTINITKNNAVFPYTTTITVTAYSYDGSPVIFEWTDPTGAVLQLASIGSTRAQQVMAVWKGQASVTAGGISSGVGTNVYPGIVYAYTSSFSYTATANTTITVTAVSSFDGIWWNPDFSTTSMSVNLYGSAATSTNTTQTISMTSLLGDASDPKTAYIGSGATATFNAYASTTDACHITWRFLATNGWAADSEVIALTSNNTLYMMRNGHWASTIVKDISAESAGLKTVIAIITDLQTGEATTLSMDITLLVNSYPTISNVSASSTTVQEGQLVQYTVDASTESGNALGYTWNFYNPVVTMYGRTVFLHTTGIGGTYITGQVTVYDTVYGQSVSGFVEQVSVIAISSGTNVV